MTPLYPDHDRSGHAAREQEVTNSGETKMTSRIACPICGHKGASRKVLSDYRYTESGLPNVRLSGGVTEIRCPNCKKRSFSIHKERQLMQVIALKLIMKEAALTGKEMRYLRGACNMTQQQLATALRRRRATVADHEAMPRPGLTEAEEIWHRLVFIASFAEYLAIPGNAFLAPQHAAMLEAFVKSYCQKAMAVADHMKSKQVEQLTLFSDENDGDWQMEAAA